MSLTLRCMGAVLCLATAVLCGCRSLLPALPPVNLDEPGWTILKGQAVWQRGKDLEIAGDVIVALSNHGLIAQFSKGPIEIVSAHREGRRWEIRFAPEGRRYSGIGASPSRLAWLQLPQALAGKPLASGWTWERNGDRWRLARPGESIEGVFSQ